MRFTFDDREVTGDKIWFYSVMMDDINSDKIEKILEDIELVKNNITCYNEEYIEFKLNRTDFERLVKFSIENNIDIAFKTEIEHEEKLVDNLIAEYRAELEKNVYLATDMETKRSYIVIADNIRSAYEKLCEAHTEEFSEVEFSRINKFKNQVYQVV